MTSVFLFQKTETLNENECDKKERERAITKTHFDRPMLEDGECFFLFIKSCL